MLLWLRRWAGAAFTHELNWPDDLIYSVAEVVPREGSPLEAAATTTPSSIPATRRQSHP
jgi:hypothetical protein